MKNPTKQLQPLSFQTAPSPFLPNSSKITMTNNFKIIKITFPNFPHTKQLLNYQDQQLQNFLPNSSNPFPKKTAQKLPCLVVNIFKIIYITVPNFPHTKHLQNYLTQLLQNYPYKQLQVPSNQQLQVIPNQVLQVILTLLLQNYPTKTFQNYHTI